MNNQRISALKFAAELVAITPEKPRLRIVLTDNMLVRRLVAQRLLRLYGTRAELYSGKNPVQEAVEALSTQNLFAAPTPVWIELPEKINQKQWGEITAQLNHLTDPARQELFIFAPTSARHGAPEPNSLPWNAEIIIIYEPVRAEAIQLMTTLIPRYGGLLAQTNKSELLTWATHAFDHYSGDLEACDLHFERMFKGGLTFAAAFIPKTGIDAFDVIEAFSSGESNLLHLRLSQLEQAGEDASSVVSALAYIGRQVLAFQAALAQTGQLRQAHDLAKIPFPSQARVQRLANLLPPEKWTQFFLVAAELEKYTRTGRDAHNWLAVELTGLLS